MSSPVFNEDTIRTMERGGSFHYDEHGNPVAQEGFGAATAPTYNIQVTPNQVFSINGALVKTAILLAIVVASALVGAFFVPASLYMPLLIVGFIATIGIAIWLARAPKQAAIGGPIYAVIEGLTVGMFSLFMAQSYGASIIAQALLGTVAVTVSMLFLYSARIIKVTDKLRSIVVSATMGIFVMYLFAFIGRIIFGAEMAWFYGNGLLSIGISAVIIVVAAFNLMLDFDLIEHMNQAKVAKEYEWYAAFGLMVTLVWLYIEILRLLAKIQSRD